MPRKKHIEDDAVLEIILAKITEVGVAGFSLEDLRESTGLSPATLIQRFGSKKALLHRAVALSNVALTVSSNITSPLHQIVEGYAGLSGKLTTVVDVANTLSILQVEILEADLHTLLRKHIKQRQGRIAELLELAKSSGQLPVQDVQPIVLNLEALWQGAVLQWAMLEQGELEQWVRIRLASYLELLSQHIHVKDFVETTSH